MAISRFLSGYTMPSGYEISKKLTIILQVRVYGFDSVGKFEGWMCFEWLVGWIGRYIDKRGA